MPELRLQIEPEALREKLTDPEELFTTAEVYAAAELLAQDYGWQRDDRLPKYGEVRTHQLIVPGFEERGVIVVKILNVKDRTINIPNLIDEATGGNFQPSQNTLAYATAIAQAKCAIVSPPGLVDAIMSDEDPAAVGFFFAFTNEYQQLVAHHNEEIRKKKSSATVTTENSAGTESASTSDTDATSSPPPPNG